MEQLVKSMVSLFTFICLLTGAHGYGDWESANATFYGGGDTFGTMGKVKQHYFCIYLPIRISLIWLNFCVQEGPVDTGICIAETILLLLALLCSTTGSAAEPATKLNVTTILNGVCLGQWRSQPQTSARQTTTTVDGATHRCSTSTWPSPPLKRSPKTRVGSSPSSTGGN